MQTLPQIINHIVHQLSPEYEPAEANAISIILLEHVLKTDRKNFDIHETILLSEIQQSEIENAITRLWHHEPIQYITGETYFYGLTFLVDKNVLIPRPETEELVDWIIKETKSRAGESLSILDIGTGSGCIAISLSKNLPFAKVFAIDISQDALAIAKSNCLLNNVNVELIESNFLNFENESSFEKFELESFDVIVSNPPYIHLNEMPSMHKNVVDFEPHLALFAGDDDLIFYKRITAFAKKYLKQKGMLFFEINQKNGVAVREILTENKFASIKLKKDISGNDRMIKAIK